MTTTQKFTTEEIEVARKKILENGAELIEEAQLLFKHRRYARTVALSLLAVEELSNLNPRFGWRPAGPRQDCGLEARAFKVTRS